MICKKCGKEIKDTAKFCGYCGSVNEPTIGIQTPEISETVNYTPSWMKQEVKTTTSTISAKQNVDIKTEISKNAGLFALPCIYLAWQIIRIFLNNIIFRMPYEFHNTYIYVSILFGCALLGLAFGGLVIAIQRCSKNFKWVYIIPLCLINIYWIVSNLDYMPGAINCIFEMSEIFVTIGIAMAMQNTSLGKENSKKSITFIAAITAAGATLAYRFVYILLMNVLFGGYSSFGVWGILIGAASTLGAVIAPAILSNVISKTDNKKA